MHCLSIFFFFFNDTATTEIYTLSLHDALPIYPANPDQYEPCSDTEPRVLTSRGPTTPGPLRRSPTRTLPAIPGSVRVFHSCCMFDRGAYATPATVAERNPKEPTIPNSVEPALP